MNRPSLYLAALLAAGAASLGVSSLGAQAPRAAPTPASALRRAQELIGDGDVERGRAVLDSLLQVLPADSPDVARVLYARAATADEAADAERDYRRVVVEYPTAEVAGDATLRLAQLELQRGERTKALERLTRLSNEQPDGPLRAQAAYWTARVYFENNNAASGCYALAIARGALQPSDVEVRNQIEYYAPRCRDVAEGGAPVPAPPVQTASTETAPPPADTLARAANDSTVPPSDSITPPADSVVTPPVAAPSRAAVKGGKGAKVAAKGAGRVAAKPAPKPVPKPAKAPGRTAAKASRTATKAGAASATRTLAPPTRTIYTVQVAAVQQKAQATLLSKQLRAAGFDARVEGAMAPFRVRVGRYATRAAADAMAGRLHEHRSDALVVEAGRR